MPIVEMMGVMLEFCKKLLHRESTFGQTILLFQFCCSRIEGKVIAQLADFFFLPGGQGFVETKQFFEQDFFRTPLELGRKGRFLAVQEGSQIDYLAIYTEVGLP